MISTSIQLSNHTTKPGLLEVPQTPSNKVDTYEKKYNTLDNSPFFSFPNIFQQDDHTKITEMVIFRNSRT